MLRQVTEIARVHHPNHPKTTAGITTKKETASMARDARLTTTRNLEAKGSDAEAEAEEGKAAVTRPKGAERRAATHAKLWL